VKHLLLNALARAHSTAGGLLEFLHRMNRIAQFVALVREQAGQGRAAGRQSPAEGAFTMLLPLRIPSGFLFLNMETSAKLLKSLVPLRIRL
jgi:hypothetical protein